MKNILKNFSYNLGINFTNLIFPIFLIPYYIHHLSIKGYGILAISFAIINYFSLIPDYGWNTIGSIEIIKHKNTSQKELNKYISRTLCSKLILLVVTICCLFLFSLVYSPLQHKYFFIFSIIIAIIGRTFNTHWIFLGFEDVSKYFFINLFSKILSFCFIIYFVKEYKDYIWVNIFIGLGDITLSVISLYLLYSQYHYKIISPKFEDIFKEFRTNGRIFFMNIANVSFLNLNIILLGWISSSTFVGIFSVAEKIITLSKNTIGVLGQTLIPRITSIYLTEPQKIKKLLNYLFLVYFIIYGFGTIIVFLFPKFWISLLSSQYQTESAHILRILAIIIFIYAISQPSYIKLLISNKKTQYSFVYITTLIFHLFFILVSQKYFKEYSIIYSMIISEIIIYVLLLILDR